MLKSFFASTALVAAFTAPQVSLAADATPSYDTYKSWFTACDNGLACQARGFSDDSGPDSPDLTISRDAGPQAKTLVTLKLPFAVEAADLKVDGQPLTLASGAWEIEREEGMTTLSLSEDADIQTLITQLRDASALQTSKPEASVPLDGFVAALLRMDDRQGRIDGVTALIRRGKAPASAVPPAPDLPTTPTYKPTAPLEAAEKTALLSKARKDLASTFQSEDCSTDSPSGIDNSDAFAVDQTSALVFLGCFVGAYQGSSLVALVPRSGNGAAELVRPSLPISDGDTDTALLTEPGFDPDTGTLSMSARGRGLGDCGLSAEWVWNGTQFQLTGGSYQMSCGGSQPGDWPTVYRSK
ncbi:DUF1176 domain-containing protein [Tianweitania sp. BSSL-BM11]|uniref:DUF1176 domain-containing protein n=1 Tax=Tianweitania aestuarii TaxID=2814886 RepID=A0ABS5RYP4_9HYPH|nr:DUF1176 domain-containing protein [Tianweitania aestuarii]MBS9722141.1 DUF1176 domain-containing protein [Tianweitania aestuarii]